MQDVKNPAAKIPTVTENLDWILHGTPISGIAYYNAKLQPGAAEYSKNAALASTVSMQALCMELTAINQFTKGGLKKINGQVVPITPELVQKYEGWLKSYTESVKIDFGTQPVAMFAVNLVTSSLDTVIHANGLGIQSVTILKTDEGKFPIFLDLCGNEGGPDFVFALVNGTAKIVGASAPAPNANLQGTPNPIDPSFQKMVDKNNQATIDAVTAATKGNASGNAPIVVIVNPVMYTGGNTLTTGGGQNGTNGRDGKDGTASSSPTITTTTTPPANVDPFAPGTPGRSLVVSNNNAPQGWVNAQNQPTAQIACSTCPGAQAQAWNRQDVAYTEQQLALNNQYNAALLKQSKAQTGIQGAQLGVQIVGTGFQIADDFGAFNKFKVRPVTNIINQIFGGTGTNGGGSSDFPNGLNGTVTNNGGSAADFRNGF